MLKPTLTEFLFQTYIYVGFLLYAIKQIEAK